MKVPYEEKLTENTIHAHGGFIPKPEKVGTVIQTLCQFQQMYDLDLSSEDKIHILIESCTIGKRKMEKYMPLLKGSMFAHLEQSNDIFVVIS